jgi:hypothetical protein
MTFTDAVTSIEFGPVIAGGLPQQHCDVPHVEGMSRLRSILCRAFEEGHGASCARYPLDVRRGRGAFRGDDAAASRHAPFLRCAYHGP